MLGGSDIGIQYFWFTETLFCTIIGSNYTQQILIDGGIFHCHTSCNHRMPAECELLQMQQTEIKSKVEKYLGSLIYILSLFDVRIDVDIRWWSFNLIAPDCAEF